MLGDTSRHSFRDKQIRAPKSQGRDNDCGVHRSPSLTIQWQTQHCAGTVRRSIACLHSREPHPLMLQWATITSHIWEGSWSAAALGDHQTHIYLHQRKGSDSAEICGTQDEFSIIQHSYDDLWFGKSIKQHIHWKFAQLNEDERMEVRTLNNRQIYRSRRNVWHAGLFIAPWSNLMCHHMRVNVCNFDGMYTFSSLMPGWVVFRPAGERY